MNRRSSPLAREVVEHLKDEPQLLAIADAIVATQRAGECQERASRRRPLLAGVAVAAAVVASVVGLQLAGESPSVEREALEAIDDSPVLYMALERRLASESIVDVRSGQSRPVVLRVASWYDNLSGETRAITTKNRNVVSDVLVAKAGRLTERGPVSVAPPTTHSGDALVRFARDYREALENGEAKKGGSRGTLVLRLPAPAVGAASVRVDRSSHLPTRVEVNGTAWLVSSVATSESRLPFTQVPSVYWGAFSSDGAAKSSDEQATPPPNTPQSGFVSGRTRLTQLPRLDRTLPLGSRAGGFELSGAWRERVVTVTVNGDRIVTDGLRFEYGRPDGEKIVILEARRPLPAYGFIASRTLGLIPVPLAPRLALAKEGGTSERWRGQMKVDDAYIGVLGSERQSVIEVARLLFQRKNE